MALRVGLTGGIGSGKSTVASIFQSFNIPIIDADKIAHELTVPGGVALSEIKAAFGENVFEQDGITLSRPRLRELVFSHAHHKKQLEAILHPLIFNEAQKQYQIKARASQIVVFDIPLLAPGSKWLNFLDRILVIDCAKKTQIERVMKRSGWTEAQVSQVIAQQASREQRLSIATDIIVNDEMTMPELEKQTAVLLKQWSDHHL